MLPTELLSHIGGSAWFRRGPAPYLVLDTNLQIRAVNRAYEQATGTPRSLLVGDHLFDAFPDNPSDPDANGVANLGRSLETVFSRGAAHWMGLQRYDVPSVWDRTIFHKKIWAPANHPIRVNGCTVGAVHHVQDVTFAMSGSNGEPAPSNDLFTSARALSTRFPTLTYEAVLGVLADSEQVVIGTTGTKNPQHAETLATLRLEILSGQPALPTV